jgi:hypothetical protein
LSFFVEGCVEVAILDGTFSVADKHEVILTVIRKAVISVFIFMIYLCKEPPNGLRHRPRAERVGYLRVGGCGQCLGAGKTRSEKNA